MLIVDDEFGLAEMLGAILADEGHRISTASNGKQALEEASTERPDLILTDMMMPVMDGAELIKALGEDPTLANVPVIIMSSLQEATVAARCEGYAAIVRKPFNIGELLMLVARFSTESSGA
ncbi:MAG: response regulator [Pseudomonadota bacterium]|nr:response regulator [Pseudomonadota bacterium]